MVFLYRILGYAALPLVLPFFLLHPKLRGHLRERFGLYDVPPHTHGPRIWVHAASAGDVKAVLPLLVALRRRAPESLIVLTTTTSTGRAMAERVRVPADLVVYAPLDLAGVVARALRSVRPNLLVLEYAELWPNLVLAARRLGARVALTDGRVSPRGLSRARLAGFLYRRVLGAIDLFLMRSLGDAERVEALGAARERVVVTGNTKYDAPAPVAEDVAALREAIGLPAARPVIVLGNTHAGEEAAILPSFARLRRDFPELLCLVAPRYPDRCEDVAQIAAGLGLRTARRSQGAVGEADVFLLDTVGELAAAYGLGVAAFVGGSFTTRGGQNVLEPALHGVPVLYGPSTDNFREEVALLAENGGQEVADAEELEGEIRALLEDPARRDRVGALAASRAHSLRGAAEENAARLSALLGAG
jgi:3-deoxy-D-manno-octulosonic-acid transferase